MYNGCLEYGITEQYKLYGSNGDKVIKVYEDLHKTKTRQEVIQAMYEKIIELGAHNVTPLIYLFGDLKIQMILKKKFKNLRNYKNLNS